MLYLADFSVMNPSFGLLFWTSIIFIFVWLVLGRFFKAIRNALKQRETDIQTAIDEAEVAKTQVKELEAQIDKIKAEAAEERSKIIAEAQEIAKKIAEEAKSKAEVSTRQMMESAKAEIDNRRKEMEVSLYNEVGKLAVSIAEQIMVRELDGNHDAFIAQKVEEMKAADVKAKYN